MDFLRQLIAGVVQAWGRLSLSARINLVLASLATLGVILLLVVTSARPQYVQLYAGLTAEDSAAIQSYLRENNIAYQLQDGGRTLLVPADERSRVRVDLAAQDLPVSQGEPTGFELLDRRDLMTNRYLQDVNYLRAVQGELQRMLNEYEFVKSSRVFISKPEEELFAAQQAPSEASVMLDLRRAVTPREIKGILHLVSSFGGANLSPSNITLTSTDGTVLSQPPETELAAVANSKLEHRSEVESYLEQKAVEAFEKANVKAIVKVSAEIDFSSQKTSSQKSESGAVLSSMTTTTTTNSTQSLPQGPPGLTSNVPGQPVSESVLTEEEKEQTLENFEPSITKTETVVEPGEIRTVKATAWVEGTYEPPAGGQGEPVYTPRSDEEIGKYKAMLATAVGALEEDVVVYDYPIGGDRELLVQEQPGLASTWIGGELWERGTLIVKLLMIILGFWLVRRFLRRALAPVSRQAPEAPLELETLPPGERRKREIADAVEKSSEAEPGTAAAILRSWMSERED